MWKEIIVVIGLVVSLTSIQGVDKASTSTLNEVVLGQTLVNVDCDGFKYIDNAQLIFVQAVEQVLNDFSANGIKAAIEPDGITCDGANVSNSSFQLMRISPRFILTTNEEHQKVSLDFHQSALPSVHIEYLLSWVVASTDVSLLNAIYVIVTTALANTISTAAFDSILQTIAQQNNVTILSSATSPSLVNLTSLKISILDQSTSPTVIDPVSKSSGGETGVDIAIEIVISVILVAVFVAVCLALLVYCHVYHKEIKDVNKCESCDVELALTDPSSKHFDINNDTSIGTNYERMTVFSTRSSEVQRMQIGRFSHFVGFGNGYEGRLSQYDDRKSYNDSRLTNSPSMRFNSTSFNHNRNSQKIARPILIPDFEWFDAELKGATLADAVIGKGSFGSVVLARLKARNEDENLITTDDVVVKVMTKSLGMSRDVSAYEKNLNIAIQEVSVLMDAESKIVFKDCIIKVYGIASGSLPQTLCETLNVSEEAAVVGIVMRLESGGSLDALIHPKTNNSINSPSKINLKDKLRLLTGIARGLAELHTVGIVHGDIKPDNILLSSTDYTTAEVRLADFGLAAVKEQKSLLNSSLTETAHFRGTPLYSAPEMLIDPYAEVVNDKVARPSRKTDVYAFAILAWEVLAEKKPFEDIKNESILGMKLHQGHRPSPDLLPDSVPNKIKNLIIACWDSKRSVRRSAVECYSTLKHYHGLMVKATYDVYLAYHRAQQTVVNFVFNRLSQRGLNVCLINKETNVTDGENTTSTSDSRSAVEQHAQSQYQEGIFKAKIVVACIDEAFQNDQLCLYEVREAQKLKKNVIPLFIQSDVSKWINGDIDYACQMKDSSTVIFDASERVCDDSWTSEDGPTQLIIHALNIEVDKLSNHLLMQIKTEHF